MLYFLKFLFIGHALSLDVVDEFSIGVRNNQAKKYYIFEKDGDRILEIKKQTDANYKSNHPCPNDDKINLSDHNKIVVWHGSAVRTYEQERQAA
jgi:hypothetical protein